MQDCSNSIANALELLQSCTNPVIYIYIYCARNMVKSIFISTPINIHQTYDNIYFMLEAWWGPHFCWLVTYLISIHETHDFPDSKVHGANMGPTWVLSAPDGPHVGPMNLAIWLVANLCCCEWSWLLLGLVSGTQSAPWELPLQL